MTRRLCALLALLAPLGMVVVVAVGLWRHPVALVGVLVLGVVAVSAIWVAITHHGARRVAGAALAVAATGGTFALFLGEGQSILWLAALLVLLVVYGSAARQALHGAGAADRAPAASPVAPSERGVLIVNLKSGGGKAERFGLVAEAAARGIRTVVLTPGDDLRQLAEDAIAGGADVIGMAGGDGSQALVATVAMTHDVPHVCIPAGTRNHFALDLGLDRDDVVGALDAYAGAIERRIDLARVNDRVFVNNASLGVYAKVVQSPEYRDAKLETWGRMLPEMLGPGAPPIDLAFEGPDGTTYDDAPLVLVSNNVYQLTRLAGAGTRARIDGATLGIVAARVNRPSDAGQLFALEMGGQAGRFPGLLVWDRPTFEVRSGSPIEVGLDGEALVLDSPLRFETLPGALRVRIPDHASGISPAAAAAPLTALSLRSLVTIAFGRTTGAAVPPSAPQP